jgi:hypothetical protein
MRFSVVPARTRRRSFFLSCRLRWITRGDAGPGQADLVAMFSMPHIKPQSASLRKFLAGGTSVTMDAWPRTTSAPSHPSGLFSGLRATRSMP